MGREEGVDVWVGGVRENEGGKQQLCGGGKKLIPNGQIVTVSVTVARSEY